MLRRPVCRNCQYDLLQSFAAIAGISLPPASRPASRILAPGLSQRWYSKSKTKYSDQYSNAIRTPSSDGQDENSSEGPAKITPNQSTPIPWYLQVDVPKPPAPSHPLAERQLIPELPENPPKILSPILRYLSIDSGLDNLSLFDLRHLDPPPALGANLLMIIGTARSVKHLNVSADRFCRWLRSNYKLRPYADGLLGRNELKLKLRRKARRLKLAQSVGNTLEASKDDGITTGWICVNLGSVEGIGDEMPAGEDKDLGQAVAQGAEEIEQDVEWNDDGYIGFGSRSTAPRIVVQMFTEEKRAELDLEGLWEARTARRATKDDKADAAAEMKSASKVNDELFAMQRPRIGVEGEPMAPGEGYDPARPSYATTAS
jgi:hypothetical protein